MIDFEELMKMKAGMGSNKYKTQTQARKELKEFLNHKKNFIEGDEVVRNKYGLNAMSFPENNQVAICYKLLDDMVTDGDEVYDMIIAVALEKGLVKYFAVPSGFYTKARTAENVVKLR